MAPCHYLFNKSKAKMQKQCMKIKNTRPTSIAVKRVSSRHMLLIKCTGLAEDQQM